MITAAMIKEKAKETFLREEKDAKIIETDLEDAKKVLLIAQKQQEVKLDKISSAFGWFSIT